MAAATYISNLYTQGLRGRVLHMPGPKGANNEVLFIYGHHSSIERWWGVAELVAQRASVTMPDLPGFGGMDSLHKSRKAPTLNNLADYLANFVRQRYGDRQITMVGMSLGFVIITRMLQRHPALTKNVKKLVSLFGFASAKDFKMPLHNKLFNSMGARFFSLPGTSSVYRNIFLRPEVLRAGYHKTRRAREKFKGLTPEQLKINMDFEIQLWHANDVRTHMRTAHEFLRLDNTKVKIDVPVYHIAVRNDRYFDNQKVEQHFRAIFTNYYLLAELQSGNHAPTAIRSASEAAAIIPSELLDALQ